MYLEKINVSNNLDVFNLHFLFLTFLNAYILYSYYRIVFF